MQTVDGSSLCQEKLVYLLLCPRHCRMPTGLHSVKLSLTMTKYLRLLREGDESMQLHMVDFIDDLWNRLMNGNADTANAHRLWRFVYSIGTIYDQNEVYTSFKYNPSDTEIHNRFSLLITYYNVGMGSAKRYWQNVVAPGLYAIWQADPATNTPVLMECLPTTDAFATALSYAGPGISPVSAFNFGDLTNVVALSYAFQDDPVDIVPFYNALVQRFIDGRFVMPTDAGKREYVEVLLLDFIRLTKSALTARINVNPPATLLI